MACAALGATAEFERDEQQGGLFVACCSSLLSFCHCLVVELRCVSNCFIVTCGWSHEFAAWSRNCSYWNSMTIDSKADPEKKFELLLDCDRCP